ncbi:hypothetical protein THAOC_31655, partial [Thalassiosira oceanica]
IRGDGSGVKQIVAPTMLSSTIPDPLTSLGTNFVASALIAADSTEPSAASAKYCSLSTDDGMDSRGTKRLSSEGERDGVCGRGVCDDGCGVCDIGHVKWPMDCPVRKRASTSGRNNRVYDFRPRAPKT